MMSIIYMNNKANNSYYCFGDDILEEAQDESLGQCDALKPVDTFVLDGMVVIAGISDVKPKLMTSQPQKH